ncbi:GNAT family N-acetyltransferase [Streptomyces sp. NPDC059698]|uniref:GNAT family N-acetyltransferase n=1 Tax=unclassified Streptomyces TaxID=2593676 RepID=UPI00093EDA87|nr:GNAT family N-acetyltransferase [Streptomyces sp. CB02366]OKJ32319.1 acetyltransferase [Streptomyces sp. CB02366]TVP34118.1 acetyltransferase [Streptomyces griseus subsp. griseus]WSS58041.1 GNAT family N-acetyltransferase [Streptomyces sp. NBC_01178]
MAAPGEGPAHPRARIGPVDLAARVDEALHVQAAAFGLRQDEIDVRRHIVLRHLEHPRARALGALAPDGRLVGFVYGLPNDRAQWWSTVVEPYLRATGTDDWLDDSFVITELHVHPDHQRHGLGRSLITAVTDAVEQPRSILSAIDKDSPARALYRSLGYRDLAGRVVFPSAPQPYAVMGAPLPLLRPGGMDFRPPAPPG